MLLVITRTDHIFAHANLDILEMDATVQVQSIISETFILVFAVMGNFVCCSYFCLCVCLFCFNSVESQYLTDFVT